MTLPTNLDYPIIAIGDLHGQLEQLERLVTRLENISEWDDCALVFLGDYVDQGEDVPGTIDFVLKLLNRRPGGSAVLGNHDLALVRATRLDDGPPSPYWVESYLHRYDHEETFLGYLGRLPNHGGCQWESDLAELNREHWFHAGSLHSLLSLWFVASQRRSTS
jgi:serine/threonine protein phosphatase 1